MSLQQKSSLDSTQPYHVYYDLDIINNDTTGLSPPPNLAFNEVRNSPYLMSPENYFMSVVRFSLQTPSLPNFIPQVMLGQSDPLKTIYSITLTYKTYEYQQFVYYIANDVSAPTPAPPLDFQDLTSSFYFIYTYQQWIEMVNVAFVSAFNGLKALVVAASDTLPSNNPPFLEFDPQQLICIIDCDEEGYDRSIVNPIKIYMNSPMFTLFSSFPSVQYGYTGITNGKNTKLVVYNNNGTNILNLPTYNAIQMYQEGSTCGLWNPVSAIVFTTALLPVIPSLVSVPKIFGSQANLFNIGNNANLAPVLTDFIVPFSPGNTYKPTIEYTPSGEYRLLGMYGTSPLASIEVSVFWKDIFGVLHPFKLNSGCSATLKIMFRRKDFNTAFLNKFISN
jgi:hypothetical protein